LLLQGQRLCHQLIDGADLSAPVVVGIAEKEIRGERNTVAQPPAEDVVDGGVPALTQQVQAGELERRQDLRAVVVERSRRVGDEEAHLLAGGRVAADEIRLQPFEGGDGALASPTHLPQPNATVVCLYFDDGAHKPPPVAAVRVAKRRVQGNGDGRGPDI